MNQTAKIRPWADMKWEWSFDEALVVASNLLRGYLKMPEGGSMGFEVGGVTTEFKYEEAVHRVGALRDALILEANDRIRAGTFTAGQRKVLDAIDESVSALIRERAIKDVWGRHLPT
jgi:hypothetical protein